MNMATEGWINEVNRLQAENDRLRTLNAEMLVALEEALRSLDGNRAMNSRGMVAYAIAKARKGT